MIPKARKSITSGVTAGSVSQKRRNAPFGLTWALVRTVCASTLQNTSNAAKIVAMFVSMFDFIDLLAVYLSFWLSASNANDEFEMKRYHVFPMDNSLNQPEKHLVVGGTDRH